MLYEVISKPLSTQLWPSRIVISDCCQVNVVDYCHQLVLVNGPVSTEQLTTNLSIIIAANNCIS